jgi:hypothetical protein
LLTKTVCFKSLKHPKPKSIFKEIKVLLANISDGVEYAFIRFISNIYMAKRLRMKEKIQLSQIMYNIQISHCY